MKEDLVNVASKRKEIGIFVRAIALFGALECGLIAVFSVFTAMMSLNNIYLLLGKLGESFAPAIFTLVFWYIFKTGRSPLRLINEVYYKLSVCDDSKNG